MTWPLLSNVRLEGAHSIDRAFRPPNPAQAVARNDFGAATDVIRRACDAWGGAYMPLVPISVGQPIEKLWVDLLDGGHIDGLAENGLVDSQPQFGYGFTTQISSGLFLLRQLMNLELPKNRLTIQTADGLDVDNPWFLSYLGTLGGHPLNRAPDIKRMEGIREDYDYGDLFPIEEFRGEPGAGDLLARLRDPNKMTAAQLTLNGLSSTAEPVDSSFPSAPPRVQLDGHADARRFGPNVVIVYEPGSVDDLALLWYLRSLHGLPDGFPLAIPATADVATALSIWRDQRAYRLWGWAGGDMTIISASVSQDRLREYAAGSRFQISVPEDVLMPLHGCGLFSTDTAHYINGRAEVPRFVPTERQAIGMRALEYAGGWSTVTVTVKDDRLPPSRALRRTFHYGQGYLEGYRAQTSTSDSVLTLFHPTGIEVLNALAKDHEQTIKLSVPGRAAAQLITMVGGMSGITRLTCPTISNLLYELTRGRNKTVISRQLRNFLKIDDPSDTSEERYQLIEQRLDSALPRPDVEDISYKALKAIGRISKLTPAANTEWVRWACQRRLLLRGFEAYCPHCEHRQWRPLNDVAPELTCHGCGQTIPEPLGTDQANLRYRASETVLRAMNADVLPHVLALRYLVDIWDGGRGSHSVFGAYPGVEIVDPASKSIAAEADVVLILADGRWVVGECKTTALGLREEDLDKLNEFASRVDAAATFVATIDSSEKCGEIWKRTTIGSDRPHFALTAEHLFDFMPISLVDQDPLDWRSSYHLGTAEVDESALSDELSNYLIVSGDDHELHRRAPWMKADQD